MRAKDEFAFEGKALMSGTECFPWMHVERRLSSKHCMKFLEAVAWIDGMTSGDFAVQIASDR